VAVNLLNFAATEDGLADQMLGLVVKRMAEQLEAQREQLVLQDAQNKATLAELEDTILRKLKEASGNILEDEVLIKTLADSKATANDVMAQVARAEKTQQRIERTRAGYAPVAKRAATLFFCVMDMGGVDPMYQYSLDWFINLFRLAMDRADADGKDIADAVGLLNNSFTAVVYDALCRSLFERHKLLLSWQLTARILVADNLLPMDQLRYLLRGAEAEPDRPAPAADGAHWVNERIWRELSALARLPGLGYLRDHVERHAEEWAVITDAPDAWSCLSNLCRHAEMESASQAATSGASRGAGKATKGRRNAGAKRAAEQSGAMQLPTDSSGAHVGVFQRLLLIRALRPDALVPAIQQFVALVLGESFIDPPPFDLAKAFDDSTCTSPLVFVLSSGADPMAELDKLAAKQNKTNALAKVSLGQGQGPIASAKVSEGIDRGMWVVLQNCHLASSWMTELEQLVESLDPTKTHPEFRLWLTSMPSPDFPGSILQNGVKVTVEPAAGLRANMMGSFNTIDEDWWRSVDDTVPQRAKLFRALAWGLCFFHALMRERRRFGPLGFNIPYEFSESDLRITLDQLHLFVGDVQYVDLPWEALKYLTGECNYGGRVTDDRDRRCVTAHLQDVYTPSIAKAKFSFDPDGQYAVPSSIVSGGAPGTVADVREWVRGLPFTEMPSVFGLHNNANIAVALAQSAELTSQAFVLMPEPPAAKQSASPASAAGAGADDGKGTVTAESSIVQTSESTQLETDTGAQTDPAAGMVQQLAEVAPPPFDVEVVRVLFPIKYEDSMNTVLIQECMRYNRLLSTVQRSLKELRRALAGETVLSGELEEMQHSIERGQVPTMWSSVAYPSMKPLASWMKDLVARVEFFNDWIARRAAPVVFWLSGFYFTQSFLTAVRQNTARKSQVAIDELVWEETVLDPAQCAAATAADAQPVQEGAWVRGLFLVGAAWGVDVAHLCDSAPRQLSCELPIMHLLPVHQSEAKPRGHTYDCPVYKTSERRGTLSTTGHSTNYVTAIQLQMPAEDVEAKFTKAGVAGLLALDD
jgi:dynein heavy chain